jgi:trehalose 6-phosphate synthase/phosphatase
MLVEPIEDIKKFYHVAKNRIIILDYDGTLVKHKIHPDLATPEAQVITLLDNLNGVQYNKLVLISGRSRKSIDTIFPNSSFDIIAEHGAMYKHNNIWSEWRRITSNWRDPVIKLLEEYTRLCENSFIETKEFALAWHYRNCEYNLGLQYSRTIIENLNLHNKENSLRIIDGNKVVEILDGNISKSHAVKYFLDSADYDFILCIGDDQTDEDMFLQLSDNLNAYTLKVGKGFTIAKSNIDSVESVINLLEDLLRKK